MVAFRMEESCDRGGTAQYFSFQPETDLFLEKVLVVMSSKDTTQGEGPLRISNAGVQKYSKKLPNSRCQKGGM
jgi:hypothetical protein